MLRGIGQEQNTQRTLPPRHLVDDGGHLHLLEAHLDVGLLQQMQVFHKGHGAEGIPL